jgi:uncharacterized protein
LSADSNGHDHQLPANDPVRLTRAHVVPFAVFMVFMLVLQLVASVIEWKHPDAPWWRQDPAHFIYPLQTLVTLGMLSRITGKVMHSTGLGNGRLRRLSLARSGIGFWLLPTALYDDWGLTGKTTGILRWLGVDARREGFDPGIFENPAAMWSAVALRFLRAAVVVALVEEIFWRGFLMRFVCDWEGDYWKQPFGRVHWKSFLSSPGCSCWRTRRSITPAPLSMAASPGCSASGARTSAPASSCTPPRIS